jgi:heme-degrading monooxygenase HmoA
MKQTDGFKGQIILVDRQSGKGLGMSFWESEDHFRATEAAHNQVRGEVTEAAGTTRAGGEIYEVGLFEVETES